ncbi:AIG2 family [Fusarium albosuccineum]|uniref:gamma-glutamylcyclotransferase n=1 Tax=Fusarium albosuccineum TaxID=1237068 RepID=A0A8H4L902_9HYPO|nr:AIG2 family [Fusarium albosuccineum]
MTSQAFGAPAAGPDAPRPATKYYFAYGSNLHLQQMKRRCPGSKFIGSAQLWHYRWQINERGYANVIEDQGHWVEGLVYEINDRDEARLDVNEGVSKNAYQKCYMTVMLRRAEATLYRRPVSWIVNNGGPSQARHQAQQGAAQRRSINHDPHWEQNVLVYISPNYIVDSKPKDEYINRINLGIVDARALGLTNDYISNCIRPFIPAPSKQAPAAEASAATAATKTTGTATNTTPQKPKVVRKVPSPVRKVKQPAREVRRPAPTRVGEPSPGRATNAASQAPARARPQHTAPRVVMNVPDHPRQSRSPARTQASPHAPQLPPRPFERASHHFTNNLRLPNSDRRRAASDVGAPPPLPPRPARRMRSIPAIIVQEGYGGSWFR